MRSHPVRRRTILRAAALGPVAGLAAGCADLTSDPVRVAVSWSATELAAFQRVLGPRADDCELVPLGDDIAAALGANLTGRPDVVALPRPSLVDANLDRLAPLPDGVWDPGYDEIWRSQLPPRGGRHYALPFKLAHSSVVWYRRSLLAEHGLEPPATWAEWLDLNDRIAEVAGVAPLALGGADGWLLARFFENVLLRHFDGTYDALVGREPGAWGSGDVRAAFGMVATMWGRPNALARGAEQALVAQFPEAVLEVFHYRRAAMVPAPDFAESVIREFAVLDDDVATFAFPAAPGLDRRLVVTGDLLVLTAPSSPAALPVTGITPRAVAAILDARPTAPPGLAPLEELRLRDLVRELDGRYRVPQEIRQPIVRTEPLDQREVALVAVPALVRHFTEFVENWAGRLEVNPAAARAWFRNSEPSLRPLFDLDHYGDDDLLGRVFDDLCVVADGLESWYVREHQSRGLLEVNRVLHLLAIRMRRDDVAALAALRIGAAHRLARRFGEVVAYLDIARSHAESTDGRARDQLDTRERMERALLVASGPEPDAQAVKAATADLDGLRAEDRDGAGRAVLLVNLGLLAIQDDRLVEALELLREAEKVARDARDAGGEAHSVELQGTAHAMRGHQQVAVRCWQRARIVFARIGEDAGEARCLYNLGATAIDDARMAGLLRHGRPTPLSRQEAALVALPLLERSKELRTGQPDTGLVDDCLARARRRLEP